MDTIQVLEQLKAQMEIWGGMQINEQLPYQVQFRIANKLSTEFRVRCNMESENARWFAEEIACAIKIELGAVFVMQAQQLLFEVCDAMCDVIVNYWTTFNTDYGINTAHAKDLFIRRIAPLFTLEVNKDG